MTNVIRRMRVACLFNLNILRVRIYIRGFL